MIISQHSFINFGGLPRLFVNDNLGRSRPRQPERAIARFAACCSHQRHPEAIGDLTPGDICRDRQLAIPSRRKGIKRLTPERREEENLRNAAQPQTGASVLPRRASRASERN
jgi:hypothetical protein